MGLRFDSVISCYIFVFPLLVVCTFTIIGKQPQLLKKGLAIFFSIFYGISFIICIADILYFGYFFKHLNASIFNWTGEQSFVTEMLLKDKISLLALALSVIIPLLFSFFVFKILKRFLNEKEKEEAGEKKSWAYYTRLGICSVLILCLCILGIRGRLAVKSPIRVGTAYFSNNLFINELGLNPVFYFLRSILDSQSMKKQVLSFIPDEEAIATVQQYFGITHLQGKSPISREKTYGQRKNYNVVLILMEGISYSVFEDEKTRSYIPFLDSLSRNSLFFNHCYSAGIHTMNGVCGSLFSYPALMQQHPFKSAEIQTMAGFPNILRKNGYQTAYFTTHDDQFDNIGGFLKANDVEFILSQNDYPGDKILSNLGVPDDYMFERAVPELNRMARNGKPFFAALLTASNHTPIIIPEYFKPREGDLRSRILEYSDWSLKKFFDLVKRESWFENTLFVLCSDHGSPFGQQLYDMAITFNHIPMMILSPDKKPEVYNNPAGQIDIFPTVMGLLGIDYKNNTFGEDLLEKKREYIFFSADNVIGCIGDSLLYTYHIDGRESLYNYQKQSSDNIIGTHKDESGKMKKYAFSMMQAAQYMLRNDLVKP
jgi:phosphoglycerol transferase MdoB-like AlkP superfamily enzyme